MISAKLQFLMDNRTYILAIDTTEENTGIGLAGESLTKIKTWLSQRNQSQELLPNIDSLFKANKIKPEQLKWVVVNLGPGSFTGLRVGISVANAFGYGLQIPVLGKAHLVGNTPDRIEQLLQLTTRIKKFQQVLPVYGSPPHITSPRHH
jgi:tRNA A37 threonylcarbamoyladenosine modification protein TsaB